MARVPAAGRVKTRLARGIGAAEALRFYRTTSRLVLLRLAGLPFWETIVAVTPDADRASPVWPQGVRSIGQGGGDLGARMQRPMRTLPPGPVCVVGTDIPGIRPSDVRRAFRALGSVDVAFGPASDGGFWLVGMRRRPRVIDPWRGVGWSAPDTLAQVLAGLAGHDGLPGRDDRTGCCEVPGRRGVVEVALTSMLDDVDEAGDLAAVAALRGRLVLPA